MFASLVVTGCGYHTAARDSSAIFGEGKTVNIPLFTNKTYKPTLETTLANYLVDEFARRKGLHVVIGDTADYALTGEVLTYDMTAIAYTAIDAVSEYRATMKVAIALRKNATQSVIWKKTVSWAQDFPMSNDIAVQQNNEEAAIQEICRHLAQQIYLKTLEDF